MATLWNPALKNDPLAFVRLAFPWNKPNTPLEHFEGPRKWQREVLVELRDHIHANNGRIDFETLRLAVSSGRGIGKSALVSWLTIWMLTTRIGSTTIVSANSEAQQRVIEGQIIDANDGIFAGGRTALNGDAVEPRAEERPAGLRPLGVSME